MLLQSYDALLETILKESKLSKDEIEQRVQAKLKQLSGLISKEGAAHIIANELGIKLLRSTSGLYKIGDIKQNSRDVEVIAKVLQIYPLNEFQRKDGSSGKVASIFVGDETGEIRITLWGRMSDNVHTLKEGDVIKINGAYVKDNQGRLELQLNDRSGFVRNPEGLSVNIRQQKTNALRKYLNEIDGSEESVEVLGTIVQAFEPKFFEICPQCQKRAKENICQEHGSIVPKYGVVLNIVLDDGSDNVRTVFFRRQAETLLQKSAEDLEILRLHPEQFAQVRHDLLGQIVKVSATPKKNEMFNRLELLVNVVNPNPDPKDELQRLEEKDG